MHHITVDLSGKVALVTGGSRGIGEAAAKDLARCGAAVAICARKEPELSRVVSEIRKRARLPGFRKGKVPTELVERKFESDIRQEVIDRLVPRYWRQA